MEAITIIGIFLPKLLKLTSAMVQARIDHVELGLRNFPKPDFRGAFYFTTEQLLNEFNLPTGPNYGVMVDAKTLLNSGYSISHAVRLLFGLQSTSQISFVRIACHFTEILKMAEAVDTLNDLGYLVYLNLMQVSTLG